MSNDTLNLIDLIRRLPADRRLVMEWEDDRLSIRLDRGPEFERIYIDAADNRAVKKIDDWYRRVTEPDRENIRDHVRRAMSQGSPVKLCERYEHGGVLFTNAGGFVAFADLGYNRDMGYFRISAFPNAKNETDPSPQDTIHAYDAGEGDPWDAYVWADEGGNLCLLGERWQIADLYQVIGEFLREGTIDPEIIPHDDPAWSTRRMWRDLRDNPNT